MTKELLFRLSAVLFGLITGLLLLEITLRIWHNTPPPLTSWRAIQVLQVHPYTTWHYSPNVRSGEVNTNNLGYRGVEDLPIYPYQVSDRGGFNIILTGGSAAFGAYAPDDLTISTKIPEFLTKRGGRSCCGLLIIN